VKNYECSTITYTVYSSNFNPPGRFYVGFEVVTAVVVKIYFFCDITPSSPEDRTLQEDFFCYKLTNSAF
jgi:hypothetical protein